MNYFQFSKIKTVKYVSFLLFFCFVSNCLKAQEMEPGVLKIKFKASESKRLKSSPISKNATGIPLVGIQSVDKVNQQFKVQEMERIFRPAGKFEAKHEKYGLHLWYKITLDASQDLNSVLETYREVAEIEISEPYYKKERITGEMKKLKEVGVENTNKTTTFNDPRLSSQWHYNNTGQTGGTPDADIDLFEAWEETTGSSDVIIAIIDGGIDIYHEDLRTNLWINQEEIPFNGIDDDNNGYIDELNGYNFPREMGEFIDPDDHGCHVAGTVGAVSNNGIGVAGIAGGDGSEGTGIRLMSCEVFYGYSGAGFDESFVFAADNGAVIAQNSWGYVSPGFFEQSVLDAIDYFIAEAGSDENGKIVGPMKGGLVVFAAGNDRSNLDYYPGYYDPVIAVGATKPDDKFSYYSNFGEWVDIAAPGGESIPRRVNGVISSTSEDGYSSFQGTSMACPHVSGVAGLIVSKFSGDITPDEVKKRLFYSSDALPMEERFKTTSGRLNAKTALIDKGMPVPNTIRDLKIEKVSSDKITLTWTDPSTVYQTLYYEVLYSTESISEGDEEKNKEVQSVRYLGSSQGNKETVTIEGLAPSKTYYFVVRAGNLEDRVGTNSNEVIAEIDTAPEIATLLASEEPIILDVNKPKIGKNELNVSNVGFPESVLSYNVDVNIRQDDIIDPAITELYYPTGEDRFFDGQPIPSGEGKLPQGIVEPEAILLEIDKLKDQSDALEEIAVLDSIYVDRPSGESTRRGLGVRSKATFGTAVRFKAPEKGFNMTHIKSYLNNSGEQRQEVIVSVYRKNTVPELNEEGLEQSVRFEFDAGIDQYTIPLQEPIEFAGGETFWIVHSFRFGEGYSMGVDQRFTSDYKYPKETFYFNFNNSKFVEIGNFYSCKVRAYEALENHGGTEWIQLSSDSGELSEEGTDNITISVDGAEVPNGNYTVQLAIPNNSLSSPQVLKEFPVKVIGQEFDLEFKDLILNFGEVPVAGKRTLPFEITNIGKATTVIDSVKVGDAVFRPKEGANYKLASGQTINIPIIFSPVEESLVATGVTLYSSDLEGPLPQKLRVQGTGVKAPVLNILDPVVVTLPVNDTTEGVFKLQNEEGSPLDYEVKGISPVPSARFADLEYGYVVTDSEINPDLEYEWNDISETGVNISNFRYGIVEKLPFTFPYYGEKKKSLVIARNGYISFDPRYQDGTFRFDVTPFPVLKKNSEQEDIIAPFWIDYSEYGSKVFYKVESDRLVVQFNFVESFKNPAIDVQMILFHTGEVRMYFNKVEGEYSELIPVTSGLRAGNGEDGVQLFQKSRNNAFGDEFYLRDKMVVSIVPPLKNSFIKETSPDNGTVTAENMQEIEVSIDAEDMMDGVYKQYVLMETNDPQNELASIPVTLKVIGEGMFVANVDELKFDELVLDHKQTKKITLENKGTKRVNLSNIKIDNPDFIVANALKTAVILPGDTLEIEIDFVPKGSSGIRFASLDYEVDGEEKEIRLQGVGIDHPKPRTFIREIDVYLPMESTINLSSVLRNAGGSVYKYTVSEPIWETATDTINFEADKLFGYTWKDNRSEGVLTQYKFEDIRDEMGAENITYRVGYPFYEASPRFQVPVDLEFEFPYVDKSYDKIWIDGYGYVALEKEQREVSRYVDTMFRNNSNAMYGYWAGLAGAQNPRYGGKKGSIHYLSTPEKLVVQFSDMGQTTGVPELFGPVTFQIVLYPDGTIKYLYEDVDQAGMTKLQSSIGFQYYMEEEKWLDGVQIHFSSRFNIDTKYKVGDQTAIEINKPKGIFELESRADDILDLPISSYGLPQGEYKGSFLVNGLDPLTPQRRKEIIINLTVLPFGEQTFVKEHGTDDLKDFEDENNSFLISPNPIGGENRLNVLIPNSMTGKITASLIDMNGRVIKIYDTENQKNASGLLQLNLSELKLGSGLYLVKLQSLEEVRMARFIKR